MVQRTVFATCRSKGAHRWMIMSLVVLLAACDEAAEPAPEPVRPVRVVTAEPQNAAETVMLTGMIRAEEEAQLAFRTGGRIVELAVSLGNLIEPDQLIGRLESDTQTNAVQAARADLAAATGEVIRSEADYRRQETLLERGFTTRVRYDQALQAFRVAQSWVDSAEAQLATAEKQLAFTALYADSAGVVTERAAEPGEVVNAGQRIIVVAREDGRDAVFDVPERVIQNAPSYPRIVVRLASDERIEAEGRIREVSPQADPQTRTFEVRVGLIDPPPSMRLGSTVTGTMPLGETAGIVLPASALTELDGQPAVFVVDPDTGIVELRSLRLARFDLANVIVEDGLVAGEVVVTAGVQALRAGQQVRIAGAGS